MSAELPDGYFDGHLVDHLRAACSDLERIVGRSLSGVLCHYDWICYRAHISSKFTWYKGDLTGGGLEPYSPRSNSTELETTLAAAAIVAMAQGHLQGGIIAGPGFSLWHLALLWAENAQPAIEIANASLSCPVLLAPVHRQRDSLARPQMMRLAGRRLRRGEAIPVWGQRLKEASAHERMHVIDVLGSALAACGAAGVDPEQAFAGMIDKAGCNHYLWRTPEGQPEAILLFATDMMFGRPDPVVRHRLRPVAICPI